MSRRFHAVHGRHPVVHEHHVRVVLERGGYRGGAVPDRGDDLDVAAHPEQELESIAEDVVVLDEHDPHRPHPPEPYSAPSRSG